jgi:hypothetical protein
MIDILPPTSAQHDFINEVKEEIHNREGSVWADSAYTTALKDIRVSKIAKEVINLLAAMDLPINQMFSDSKYYAEAIASMDRLAKQDVVQPDWQVVKIAGLVFYIDH